LNIAIVERRVSSLVPEREGSAVVGLYECLRETTAQEEEIGTRGEESALREE